MCGWAYRVALIGVGLVCPAAALAHGGDAKIVRVAALDEEGSPWLLQLSEGLALRDAAGWRFVCPEAFEASSVVDSLSIDGGSAWVATLRGLFRIARDGTIDPVAGRCGDTPGKLVAHGGAMHMLARDSVRAQHVVCVVEDAGPREIYASDDAIDDLASDGTQLWLARQLGDGFQLEAIGADERRYYPPEFPERAVRLAYAGGRMYATLIDFGRTTLVRLLAGRVEALLHGTSSVYGPVESDGVMYAGADGSLVALEAERDRQVDTPLRIDDIGGVDGKGFAFAGGALYPLQLLAAGTSDPSFALDGLNPPVEQKSEVCSSQWQRLQLHLHGPDHAVGQSPTTSADAGAAEDASDADASTSITSSAGCSVGSPGAQRLPGLLLTCFAMLLMAGVRYVLRVWRAS